MLDLRLTPAFLRRATALFLVVMLAFSLAACGGQKAEAPDESPGEPVVETSEVILASTTSTEDSGLFGEIIPAFEEAYPQYKVSVVAVGTGQALEIGRNKDADVLLVHAKSDEEEFVAEGYGIERRDVMYNDFIIVGPESDPAGIKGETDAKKAFEAIANGKHLFVSRGDDSGTHKREMSVWKAAGIEPAGDWYNSIGQGMGDTLQFASESEGYTLTDRGTYLSMKGKLDLVIAVEGDPLLLNQYGVIVVTDANNLEGGQAFADWVVSPEAQDVIAKFGVAEFGEPLFVPNAK
ncbi:MAG: substrate-binding domain-containing protein [Coriobacteriia bacterium]|nr:substrate-binding domain-containing protein [Coriobacteriia bacterium]